jgi:hypothetical protein
LIGSKNRRWLLLVAVLIFATLACATNTPVAQIATPRPTRTPIPTFTATPIPPTPTPRPTDTPTPLATLTPTPTDTPLATATPQPTDTAVPAATPVPPTPPPAPTAAPPTNTPIPPPTPIPVAQSVLATPTNTPAPDTPSGKYEIEDNEPSKNCAHVAVVGRVLDRGDDPVQYVTIQVTGDKSDYKGPYTGKTDKDGYYTVLIGELNEKVDGVEFEAKVIGPNVKTESHKWKVSSDCHEDGAIQVMEIKWQKKDL